MILFILQIIGIALISIILVFIYHVICKYHAQKIGKEFTRSAIKELTKISWFLQKLNDNAKNNNNKED